MLSVSAQVAQRQGNIDPFCHLHASARARRVFIWPMARSQHRGLPPTMVRQEASEASLQTDETPWDPNSMNRAAGTHETAEESGRPIGGRPMRRKSGGVVSALRDEKEPSLSAGTTQKRRGRSSSCAASNLPGNHVDRR